jgi:hypothetical protein
MIKLFISDIDGCLSEPFQPYALEALQILAGYAVQAGAVGQSARPALTICSGRPAPYVEAMAQALGVQVPVLFEAGAGLYDPVAARYAWHPDFSADLAAQIEAVARWIVRHIIPGTAMAFDHTKRTQAGLIGPDAAEVQAAMDAIEAFVTENHPALRVVHTPVSVDVLPRTLTKQQGMVWLAAHLGVSLTEIAFIGDTHGDLDALGIVGHSFAPANAIADVRQAVQHVTAGRVIDGVLEAYHWCCAYNERLAAAHPPSPAGAVEP